LWRSYRMLAGTVMGEAIISAVRGGLFIWGPRSTATANDYRVLRQIDPGFTYFGIAWLVIGVTIAVLLVTDQRVLLPRALILFGALQLGWAAAIVVAAFSRSPVGNGLDGALNYTALAFGCWLLSFFVEWAYIRADPGR
jgi:hypothetical protein